MKRLWLREEVILALYLYYQIPFGKIHSTNAEIIDLATLLGRTPAALCMKMCNLARFDITLANRKVNGLKNGSKLDQLIWNEFEGKSDLLIDESNKILNEYLNQGSAISEALTNEYIPRGGDIGIISSRRQGQEFFRASVLAAYNYKCCITNISIPELLIASHIKPWKDSNSEREKLNPRNGLCLNAFFDKAFDRGLITLSRKYEIVVAGEIKKRQLNEADKYWLLKYEGLKIDLPERFPPDLEYIEYHNDKIFIG